MKQRFTGLLMLAACLLWLSPRGFAQQSRTNGSNSVGAFALPSVFKMQPLVPDKKSGSPAVQNRSLSAQTTAITLDFSGANRGPGCVVCTGDYACSSGVGVWNNGIKTFTDPVPAGMRVTSFQTDVYMTCGGSTASVNLNNTSLGSFTGPGDCSCGSCYVRTVTASSSTGVTGYVYGGTNAVQLLSPNDAICVDRMVVTLTYDYILNISAPVIAGSSFCPGTSVAVGFTATSNGSAVFNAGNTFTAQLSDASGSFASPVAIGTLAGTASGNISATIPANAPAGSGYRVRVVSSSPVVTGADNGSNLTVRALPTATLSGGGSICAGASASLRIGLTGTGPWSVTYTNGTTPTTVAATASPLLISVSPASTTTYSLTAVSDAQCNGTTFAGTATVSVTTLAATLTPTNVGCYGAHNGAIATSVTGGTASTYAWTGPNGFTAATANLNNLGPGTYTLNVSTASGCSATASTTLTEPLNLTPVANADQLNAVACTPLIISASALLANDSDPQNATLQVSDVLAPSSGTLLDNHNGTFTYTPAPGFTGTATFQYVIKKNDALVAYSGNGHLYEYVGANGICWDAARTAAAGRAYQGMRGYLATITSAGENAFAAAKLLGNGWIGASDEASEGVWKWMTGPEAGQQFWQGAAGGAATNGSYTNWQSGEPNDAANEDYAHFYGGVGTWNDFRNCRPNDIQGYVVEYGGLEGCIPVLTATASVTVTVAPAPVTVLARNITVALDANGTASITAAQVNNGSSSACALVSVDVSPSSFTCANTGANPVTLTVTDANGTVGTASATVTVLDNTAPAALAHDITVQLDASGNARITSAQIDNGSTDNCAVAALTVAPSAFTCANAGPNAVVLTVTDASGNVSTASATVTVVDRLLPTIAAPAALTVSTDAGQCTARNVVLGTATVADNCSASVANDAPAAFPIGLTTVTWTATDAAGNVATATQQVTVADNESPTLTAPPAVVVSTDAGQCRASNVLLGSPLVGDNCAGANARSDAPATFAKGTTTVTWTATDAAGNTTTATQTVTVTDTELPTITAPAAMVVSTDAGECSASNVALGTPLAGDNCTGVQVTNNAPSTFAKGTTTVTWKATDAAGNEATATQQVTVNDTERPVLAALPNIAIDAPANRCGAVVSFNTPFSDNCGATVVASPASGSFFAVGTTTVTVTATDAARNSRTSSFTVTVSDATAPTAVAKTIDVTLVNGSASVTADQVNNGSNDACGIRSMSLSKTSFDCSNIGLNYVTLTVTDIHGFSSTATGAVNVRGDVPVPTIAASPASLNVGKSVVIYLGYGSPSATLTASSGALTGVRYAWTAATGLSTTTGASTVFTPTAEGIYNFTVTATSTTGCTGTATIKVYVEDVRCGNGGDKVQVCHNGQAICVASSSLNAHLGHGDKLGDCKVSFPRDAAGAPSAAVGAAANELAAFPNPVTENATVIFRTAQDGPAQVLVYNELGQRVATLYDGVATAGQPYSLTLRGQPLAAGLYVCRLVANGKTQTLRLTIIR